MKAYFLVILLMVFLIVGNPVPIQARCITDKNGHEVGPCMMPQTPIIFDSYGHQINGAVKAGQQIQIIGYLTNYHYTNQTFAYIVQIQDANGVTMSLSWLVGNLGSYQSFKPAQSWIPLTSGTYTVQIFLWSGLDNPIAFQVPESTSIEVV